LTLCVLNTDEMLRALEVRRLRNLSATYVSGTFDDVARLLPYSCGLLPALRNNYDFINSSTTSNTAAASTSSSMHARIEQLLAILESFILSGRRPNTPLGSVNKIVPISPGGQNVCFHAGGEDQVMSQLQENAKKSMALTDKVRELHAEVIASPQYVTKSVRPPASYM
jgi:hypothetical protein